MGLQLCQFTWRKWLLMVLYIIEISLFPKLYPPQDSPPKSLGLPQPKASKHRVEAFAGVCKVSGSVQGQRSVECSIGSRICFSGICH